MDDTIVAISSPPGRSLRGLVRLSGPQARALAGRMLVTPLPPPRTLAPGRLTWGEGASHADPSPTSPTLPVMVLHLPSPGSYTGQDIIEMQCPGQPALLQRVVRRFIGHGARSAEPGEFTFRAYLAGKLDLTQAEGVAATIAAQSDAQWQAATLLRQGRLGDLAHHLVDDLAEALAAVEAGIDFTDQEDVRPIDADVLLARLDAIQTTIDNTLTASGDWGELEALPRVVLVGAPSVGKSTLFNALLGRQRSIISAQPGTTRDILTEPLTLPPPETPETPDHPHGLEVMLVDVAGLDEPRHALDHQMQATSRQAIAQADLLLAIGDDITAPPASQALGDKPVIRLRTKADLPTNRSDSQASSGDDELPIIAPQGVGLDALRQAMARALSHLGRSVHGELLTLGPRHQQSLRLAHEHLEGARACLLGQPTLRGVDQPELVAASLRLALDDLAALGGQMTPDDVIGKVFATFCVGK